MKCVIADTGPLVAILDRQDQDHSWAVREGRRLPPKMLAYDAVFEKRPKARIIANFIREHGAVKLMQIRFEKL